MCSIIASFDVNKFKKLYELNSYRGALSYSMCEVDTGFPLCIKKLVQKKEKPIWDNNTKGFLIGHSQAPTSQTSRIHPAKLGSSYLWHNGIIKEESVPENKWDTLYMLEEIESKGWDVLSEIDGAFACMLFRKGHLYVFRNEISPLFYDDNFSFSSTKFENSRPLNSNVVYEVILRSKRLEPMGDFNTKENPYFFY